jgi:lipoic acid synthetase
MKNIYKKSVHFDENLHKMKVLLRNYRLHTVCEEARCPNISECFSKNHLTFMILGDICTRNCKFCDVSSGRPFPPDEEEPNRIAKFVKELGIKKVIITSVTRDDLHDGGALHFYKTVRAIKDMDERIEVEVLTPDFKGNHKSLSLIISSGADVVSHNIETVKRLYPVLRPAADYKRSLKVIKFYKQNSSAIVKSGFMVGLGESEEEVYELLKDLKECGCDMVVIGQYFQPSSKALKVIEYLPDEIFLKYEEYGKKLGMEVKGGRYYRSSYVEKSLEY